MRRWEESLDLEAGWSFCQDPPVYWTGKGDGGRKGCRKDNWNIGLEESLGYCWGLKTCLDLENCWEDCLGWETSPHGGRKDSLGRKDSGGLEDSWGWEDSWVIKNSWSWEDSWNWEDSGGGETSRATNPNPQAGRNIERSGKDSVCWQNSVNLKNNIQG